MSAVERRSQRSGFVQRLWRDNGLSITLGALFVMTLAGQVVSGYHVYNEEQREHRQPTIGYGQYLQSNHFLEATFENWESEFLQMAIYVLFTVFLFQRGSAESKDPDVTDRSPRRSRAHRDAPWPVRRGGLVLRLYENSLTLAFALLFLLAFVIHVRSGAQHFNEEQLEHGQALITAWGYLGTSQLWFESFQNWQSEFLAIGMMVVLSIFLRQKGSPESKPVDSPHAETGG